MEDKKPLVSVIMTAKNFERFVDEAIASIMNQTYKNLELVVVDDASTDKTADIIRGWEKKDGRVVAIFNTESILPSRARNKAAQIARGKYLAILDSDDVALPERLSTQVDYMETHPELAAIGSHAEIIDVNGKHLSEKRKSKNITDIRYAMVLQNQFIHSSVMMRKGVFDRLGGYRSEYDFAEDYDIFSRILETGDMSNVDAVLIRFRASSGGVTTQSATQKVQAENSLKVTMRNSSRYITLSPEKMKNLTDMMNNKKLSLLKIISGLNSYKKLTESYVKKNKLAPEEINGIMEIYRNKVRSVMILYLKRFCKID